MIIFGVLAKLMDNLFCSLILARTGVDMDDDKGKNLLKGIPDAVTGWVGLIGVIVAFIVAIRSERQLYVVVVVGSILIIWLAWAILIVFARLPGKNGKQGSYRHPSIRWTGFLSIGLVVGFVVAFSLFEPNRSYVAQAIVGTPTPTATPTASPLPISVTETATSIPFPTSTETPIPTPTPIILFQDNFLNNNNGWELRSTYASANPSVDKQIIGGKLLYKMDCPAYGSLCRSWFHIPRVEEKNFDLEFDTKITNRRGEGPLIIFVVFRDTSDEDYRIGFSNMGLITMYLNESTLVTDKPVFSSRINQGLNELNHFRIVAHDAAFTVYVNGEEVTTIEDGNNTSIGTMSLGIELIPDAGGTVEFDNVLIREVP